MRNIEDLVAEYFEAERRLNQARMMGSLALDTAQRLRNIDSLKADVRRTEQSLVDAVVAAGGRALVGHQLLTVGFATMGDRRQRMGWIVFHHVG